MREFEYRAPTELEEALELLREGEGSRPLAGGTDLLGGMRRGVSAPARLVNLKGIPGLKGVRREDESLVIGALTPLAEVAGNPDVAEVFPALVQAIERTATPQIRNVGTLGGNLCQQPRCWYYRHPDFPCVRKCGEGCFAVAGQNRYHAVFGGHGCFIAHPSDTAPVLVALEGEARIAGSGGRREVPLAELFVGPEQDPTREVALERDEILAEVRVPLPAPGRRGIFLKVSERRATDFALASAAVVLVTEGERVKQARIVLGGVAPVPWRVAGAEEVLCEGGLADAAIERACAAAVEGAHPMSQNGFKVALVKGILGKGLRALRAD